MAEYLFPGTIIQKIDDEQLVLPQGKDTDIWTEYMGDSTRMSDVGWCVPAESFLGEPASFPPSAIRFLMIVLQPRLRRAVTLAVYHTTPTHCLALPHSLVAKKGDASTRWGS